MDVRDGMLRLAGWSRVRDRLPLGHALPALDAERTEVRERCLMAVGRLDGDRKPVRRNVPRIADIAGHGSTDRTGAVESNVDPTVLSSRVWVVSEGELAKDWTIRGPGPSPGVRDRDEQPGRCRESGDDPSRCLSR